MPKMIKAIYSKSLHCRFQIYDDGAVVGFSHPSQTLADAKMRVQHHLDKGTDPYEFGMDTPENDKKVMDSVTDWKTIYAAKESV